MVSNGPDDVYAGRSIWKYFHLMILNTFIIKCKYTINEKDINLNIFTKPIHSIMLSHENINKGPRSRTTREQKCAK